MASPCTCVFDSKVFLEYFKVILSFPTVVLVLVGISLALFRQDIKRLFPRFSKLGTSGIELSPEVAAAAIGQDITEADKQQQSLRETIDKLPDSEEKASVQRLQEAIAEANRERLIAAGLREQLALASKPTRHRAEPTPSEIADLAAILAKDIVFDQAIYFNWIPRFRQNDGVYRVTRTSREGFVNWCLTYPGYDAIIQEKGIRLVIYALWKAFDNHFGDLPKADAAM